MEINLFNLFSENPALVVFVAIGLGFLVGRINIKGFELGSTSGVLLVGLVFGHFGFSSEPIIGTVGFVLFIYSVGLQAGPRFFNVMLEDGRRYVALSMTVAIVGFAAAGGLAVLFGLDNGFAAGVLAGALTSTPTLVGAQNALDAGIAVIEPGLSEAVLHQHITAGYAITYIFGTVGLILIVKFVPSLVGIDLAEASRRYAMEKGFSDGERTVVRGLPMVRGYEVVEGGIGGRTRREIESELPDIDIAVVRLLRDGEALELDLDDEVMVGDRIAILAPPDLHTEIKKTPGLRSGVLDADLLDSYITTSEIVVTTQYAVGRSLRDLRIVERFGCFVTRIVRSQIDLPVAKETTLMKADVLTVAGDAQAIESLAEHIGSIEKDIKETDLATFALGIALGLVIGLVSVRIGNISVGIGSAGGLLLAGVIFGYLRSSNPTFGRVPPAARYIIMELGLMLFMVNVGINAGAGVVEVLLAHGPTLILCGVIVLLLPVALGYAFGVFVLRLNPALLLGSLTGAMTSTPALSALQHAAKSSTPALGYAGTYAISNVLLTLAGTAIMLF